MFECYFKRRAFDRFNNTIYSHLLLEYVLYTVVFNGHFQGLPTSCAYEITRIKILYVGMGHFLPKPNRLGKLCDREPLLSLKSPSAN